MRVGSRARRWAGDLVVVVALAAGELEVWLSGGSGSRLALSVLVVAGTLPLLLRRSFALAAPLASLAVFVGSSLFVGRALAGELGAAVPAALVAGWALGRGNERRSALLGFAGAYICFLVVILEAGRVGLGDVVYGSLQLVTPWLAGQAVRGREAQLAQLGEQTARLEREREQRARAAVANERLLIARELHDIVAHSVSLMTVQAGGARLLLENDRPRAEEALLRVEETGRRTLSEMRRLPGVLGLGAGGEDRGRRASLANLSALVDEVRAAGLPVDIVVSGVTRPLPAGLDLAAYRVVQEALTNTLKHAGPATARVRVRYGPQQLELEVVDDGRGKVSGGGGGHGLVGMRERVSVYGGEFTSGERVGGGGYSVRALLPLERGGR